MSTIDNAIARLQDIILSSSDVTIKAAPDYPISDAAALPLAIAHVGNGNLQADNKTTARIITNIFVDVHFPRQLLKSTYQQIDALIIEYARRLAGDPTLNGTVQNIVFPVTWEAPAPVQWDSVQTQMVRFTIPVKTLETPI